MSDKDDAGNLTIGPQQARRASSGTRVMRAIEDTKARRAARSEGISVTAQFWIGMIRNFLLGIPFTGLGYVYAYRALQSFQKRLDMPEAVIHFKDLLAFVPAAGLLVVGVAFLAPGQVEAAARFLGLGGIVDRLPFMRAKAPAGAP